MFDSKYGPKKDIRLTGHWFIKNYGPDGVLKDHISGRNVITEVGLEFLASYLYSGALAAATFTMQYIAIGTDSTAEAASNTALGAQTARVTGTVSYVSNAIFKVTSTFAAGTGTGAIVEYGLFSSSSAGTMMSRDVEAVINKEATDTLVVSTEITLS